MDLKEWADLHGEPRMSLKEFDRQEAAEKEYRRQRFTLTFTPDELDWLFGDVMRGRAFWLKTHSRRSEALDVDAAIEDWQDTAMAQGYRGC